MAERGSSLDRLNLPGKIVVGLILVLMVGAAYFVVFYGDVESQIDTQRQALAAKRKELANAEKARAAYNKDLAEKSRREQLARKQKKILPDESESPAFLSTLQTVATISGIELTSWKPLDEQPAEFYAKVPMELELRGRYHQIAKFFHGVGQVDRIINMENIVVKIPSRQKKADATDTAVEVEVECLATAFRALRSAEGGAAAGRKGRRGRGKERGKGK